MKRRYGVEEGERVRVESGQTVVIAMSAFARRDWTKGWSAWGVWWWIVRVKVCPGGIAGVKSGIGVMQPSRATMLWCVAVGGEDIMMVTMGRL